MTNNNVIYLVNKVKPIYNLGLNSDFSSIVIKVNKKNYWESQKYDNSYIFWVDKSKLIQKNVADAKCLKKE